MLSGTRFNEGINTWVCCDILRNELRAACRSIRMYLKHQQRVNKRKSQAKMKTSKAPSNDREDGDDDVGALI